MPQLTTGGSEINHPANASEVPDLKHQVTGERLYAPKKSLSEQELQDMPQLFPSLVRSQHQGEEVVTFPNSWPNIISFDGEVV